MVVRRSGQFKPLQGQLTLAAAQLNHIEEAAARHEGVYPKSPGSEQPKASARDVTGWKARGNNLDWRVTAYP